MTTTDTERTTGFVALITAADAAGRVAAGALLIDVRSAAGRAAHGTIPGAVIVVKDEIARHFDPRSPDGLPGATSREAPLVVICGSVVGSGPAAAELVALGYRHVAHVDGGFPAWQAAGLPTEGPTTTGS